MQMNLTMFHVILHYSFLLQSPNSIQYWVNIRNILRNIRPLIKYVFKEIFWLLHFANIGN